MSPIHVEIAIPGRRNRVWDSGKGGVKVKDPETGIGIEYFGDRTGVVKVTNTNGTDAGSCRVTPDEPQALIEANIRTYPPVEKNGEPTILADRVWIVFRS